MKGHNNRPHRRTYTQHFIKLMRDKQAERTRLSVWNEKL